MLPGPLDDVQRTADSAAGEVPSDGGGPLLSPQLGEYWSSVALGIILAGGVYPAVLAGMYSFAGLLHSLGSIGVGDIVGGAIILAMYTAFAAMVGCVWATVAMALTLPFVALVVYSLKLRGSIVRLGAFAGGLAGFVAVLPITLSVPLLNDTNDWMFFLIWLGLGPLLTTVIGQAGGAWGAWRGLRAAARRGNRRRYVPSSQVEQVIRDEGSRPGAAADRGRLRFGMRHMMWAMVWVSVLLTLIRLCGIPFELAIPLLVGWLAVQVVTTWTGERLFRWLGFARALVTEAVPRGTIVSPNADYAFHVKHADCESLPVDVIREVVSRETDGNGS